MDFILLKILNIQIIMNIIKMLNDILIDEFIENLKKSSFLIHQIL